MAKGAVNDGKAKASIPLLDGPGVAPRSGPSLFPVTYSTLDADAVRILVSQAYLIDTPISCQLLRRGMHDTYLVTARDGRYIARVYRARRRTPSDICYELELLTHLAARGVSVSVPIATHDGRLMCPLFAPEGLRHVALFTYAKGTPLSWEKEEHCYLAGKLLAALHAASEDFVSRHRRFCLDLSYLIDAPLAAIRPFLVYRSEKWTCLELFAARLRARAERTICKGLEWGVCHGDFGGNIHIADNQTLTVFDFDFCGLGWRAYDFVAAYGFSRGQNKPGIWHSFVKGYTETRCFTAADLASAALFQAMNRLWSIGIRASNADHRGILPMSSGDLDRRLRFFREWEAEHRDSR
jgi:Ser/Thr protein kinase RdoA (MazF antagonist)